MSSNDGRGFRNCFLGLAMAALVLPAAAAQSPQAKSLHERLQVATVVHWPGGRTVWAGHPWPPHETTSLAGEMYTSETICAFQTNIEESGRVRGYGWKYSLTILAEGTNAVTVRADWHQAAPAPAGTEPRSRQISLGLGDAVVLDRIEPGPVPDGHVCDASTLTLEVRLCGGTPDPCSSNLRSR